MGVNVDFVGPKKEESGSTGLGSPDPTRTQLQAIPGQSRKPDLPGKVTHLQES